MHLAAEDIKATRRGEPDLPSTGRPQNTVLNSPWIPTLKAAEIPPSDPRMKMAIPARLDIPVIPLRSLRVLYWYQPPGFWGVPECVATEVGPPC